ncbi:MAG: DSD1 family PLP-dependent enzyme [Planctomycetota bacterium]|nr:MAG: DSD1 family PLP-dependent enzyme [Planctomycetota bacterium]
MADFFRGRKCQLRPHFKNHKCTTLARHQLEAGSAVGITCAKLGEAEVLADAGISDVLIANQVVGPAKAQRLISLASRLEKLRVAVDHIDQAVAISEAAKAAGVSIGILVEVDIGMGRCGVPPGEAALKLARRIVELAGVRFDGLQAYEGHLVDIPDMEERRCRTIEAIQQAIETRDLIEDAGIKVPIISSGSTSTYSITSEIDGVNEIQAGTYPTMDWMYRRLTPEFELSLSVLARVISRPKAEVAVLDVGFKGLGHEFGPPKIKGLLDEEIATALAEEHCIVQNSPDWKSGEAVELIPSHACTTCNLYRQIHVHEQGRLVDVWPIEASGRLS